MAAAHHVFDRRGSTHRRKFQCPHSHSALSADREGRCASRWHSCPSSACDTASGGAATDGREVESFGVLAQRQGAKAVLASLWPVADASTRQLMQEFYRLRGEGEGMTKAEALRRAQLELLRGGADARAPAGERRGLSVGVAAQTRFSHPYFWAPFILIGNWR
jgi:CHAT domain-containing protein